MSAVSVDLTRKAYKGQHLDALVNQRVFISKSSTFLIGEVERQREARLKEATQVKT